MISIIVPIYKVEEYLDRCIQSIVNQTYTDLECILVDDGSPDNCPSICDEWAKKDERIKVIHKKNGGLSDARNAGYAIAEGEYISFIDSDDWISKDFLEVLYTSMLNTNSDICECEVYKTFGDEPNVLPEFNIVTYNTIQALEHLIKDNILHQHVWNKLYKRSVIKDILFEVGKTNEDEFWTYQIFGNASNVCKVNQPLYYYLQRENSIMSTKYSIKRLDALEAKYERQKYIETNFKSLESIAKVNLYGSMIYAGQMSLKYLNGKELEQAKSKINNLLQHIQINKEDLKVVNGTNCLYYRMAKINFWKTCKLKNVLRKGC